MRKFIVISVGQSCVINVVMLPTTNVREIVYYVLSMKNKITVIDIHRPMNWSVRPYTCVNLFPVEQGQQNVVRSSSRF